MPIQSSRGFRIYKDYCDVGCNIYKKSNIRINTGLTILVGCNGIGKTTLIRQLRDKFKKDGTPFIEFNNLSDGGSHARSIAGFRGDFSFLATAAFSSEGENIFMNLSKFAKKIVDFAKQHQSDKEIWIFMDAIDSGYSIDNIVDIKDFCKHIIKDFGTTTEVYIIISANEYELARGEACFDVLRGKYIRFNSYEEYREFILETRNEKNKRVYKN